MSYFIRILVMGFYEGMEKFVMYGMGILSVAICIYVQFRSSSLIAAFE